MKTISAFGQQLIDLSAFGTIVTGTTVAGLYDYILKRLDTRKIFTLLLNGVTYDMSNNKIVKSLNAITDKDEIKITYNMDTSYEYYIIVDETGAVTIDKTAISGGSTYELPIASSETLGGIKVGSGLSINSETGVLSADGGSSDTVVIDMTSYQLDDAGNSVILTQEQYAALTNTIITNANKILIFKGILRSGTTERYSIAVLPQNITEIDNSGQTLKDYTLLGFTSLTTSEEIDFTYDGTDCTVFIRTTFLNVPEDRVYSYGEEVNSFVITPSQTTATLRIEGTPGPTFTQFINLYSDQVNFVAIYSDAGATTQTFGHDRFDYTFPVQNALADKAWTPVTLVSNGVGTDTKFLINAQYLNDYTIIVSIKQDT